jgi:hypothetical protein
MQASRAGLPGLLPLLLLAAIAFEHGHAATLAGQQLEDFNCIAEGSGTIPVNPGLSPIAMFNKAPFCAAAEESTGKCFVAVTRCAMPSNEQSRCFVHDVLCLEVL